jgi:hypothetical protein
VARPGRSDSQLLLGTARVDAVTDVLERVEGFLPGVVEINEARR